MPHRLYDFTTCRLSTAAAVARRGPVPRSARARSGRRRRARRGRTRTGPGRRSGRAPCAGPARRRTAARFSIGPRWPNTSRSAGSGAGRRPAPQRGGLRFRQERAAARESPGRTSPGQRRRVRLRRDRRREAVVEQVADAEFGFRPVRPGAARAWRPGARTTTGSCHGLDRPPGGLEDRSRGARGRLTKPAAEPSRPGGSGPSSSTMQLSMRSAGESGEDVFDQRHAGFRRAEGGSPGGPGHRLDAGGNGRRAGQVGAAEHDAGVWRGGVEAGGHAAHR